MFEDLKASLKVEVAKTAKAQKGEVLVEGQVWDFLSEFQVC